MFFVLQEAANAQLAAKLRTCEQQLAGLRGGAPGGAGPAACPSHGPPNPTSPTPAAPAPAIRPRGGSVPGDRPAGAGLGPGLGLGLGQGPPPGGEAVARMLLACMRNEEGALRGCSLPQLHRRAPPAPVERHRKALSLVTPAPERLFASARFAIKDGVGDAQQGRILPQVHMHPF